jgi:hypothetical protein
MKHVCAVMDMNFVWIDDIAASVIAVLISLVEVTLLTSFQDLGIRQWPFVYFVTLTQLPPSFLIASLSSYHLSSRNSIL